MHVIIIGGGIAGLSQALSLHQIGIGCRVYEAVPTLAPLGYGINLQPNAIRELTALGLGELLAAAGVLTQELAFYNKHGQLIWTEPRGRAAGYRWPQISISRGELHKILLAAIRERLGRDAVVTGHRLIHFEQRGDTIIAHFADPSGKPAGEAEGDILIGADGIHSAVRQHFYKGEKAVFDGYLHYRGIVEAAPYLTGASMAVVGHRTHRAIIYPVMQRPGGKVMINWLAYTKIPPGSPPLEAWDTAADKQACVDQFQGWTYPWLDVHGLFAATPAEHVLQLPNVDRDPIPRWSFGRVSLIGDAAHPMQPVGAQAGSQAVVDGRVLAASLMATRDSIEALTHYQNERIAAMNDMIVRNRNLGLESILQTAEERAPEGFQHIHDVLSQEELEHTAISFKKAAGFDVETVNSRKFRRTGGDLAMSIGRRRVLQLGAAAAALPALTREARSQGFPNRFVRLIVPFPPGGGGDALARPLAQRLSEVWGQQVVVENKGGAGGNVGAYQAANSPADGYTLLLGAAFFSINPYLYPNSGYNPATDLAPVTLVTLIPNVMMVPNSSPAKTVQEFIDYAKANRGNVTFASTGVGASPHLSGELFKRMAGIEMTHVPYRGAGPAMNDLVPGRVDAMFSNLPGVISQVSGRTIRGLAVTTAQRNFAVPDIPTIGETVAGYEVSSWWALYAPARTPADIVAKIHSDAVAALMHPFVKQRYEAIGAPATPSTPVELTALMKADLEKWGPIIKEAGIKPE